MRRAAISIPSDIAEGEARKSTAEFVQVLSVSKAGGIGDPIDCECGELGFCAEAGGPNALA